MNNLEKAMKQAVEGLQKFAHVISRLNQPKQLQPFNPRIILAAPTTDAELTVCMFYYGRISRGIK